MSTELKYSGAIYEVRDNETALDALIRGGANVQFSCRKGSCQICLMQATSGVPPERSQRGLRTALKDSHHFMPCMCKPTEDLELGPADLSVMYLDAVVISREELSPKVTRLLLEPEVALGWKPGQYLNLRRPDGLVRSYSIASLAEEDYYIELHVGRVEDGEMSTWIHQELAEGDFVQIQGPVGDCIYFEEYGDRDLVLIATGTGIAPIVGVVRDALRQGHRGNIRVAHAASSEEEVYLESVFRSLAETHGNLTFQHFVGPTDLVEAFFDANRDCADAVLYLCGNPEMVYAARVRAIEAGIHRDEIHADPFSDAHPYWPRDKEKMEAWPTEPELWARLEEGALLRRILVEFYDIAFDDARLGPFFHNVTKERAISKQYEFLADIFAGEIDFFGLKPFNAHHWMVISDELFDYRENIFEDVVRRHMDDEPLILRWMAFQELFRRDIVKSHQRGMIIDGVERMHEGYSDEVLEFGMMCDGCYAEMPAGSHGRMHKRTGKLFCDDCSAKSAVNSVGAPSF